MRRLKADSTFLVVLSLLGIISYLLNGPLGPSYLEPNNIDVERISNRALANKHNPKRKRNKLTKTIQHSTRPNIIFIQHESLSGSILLNTREGITHTQSFHKRMKRDPNFYVFQHHRTGSGNTIDAMPSLMTGCLPYTEKGMKYAHAKGRSIGYEFAKEGYATASFSSRSLDETLTEGQWKILYDMLVGGMEYVEDAMDNPNLDIDNGQGSSDGQMIPLFEKWLNKWEGRNEELELEERKPFYAQFYNFNQHFPYLNSINTNDHEFSKTEGDDYYSSLKATDNFLESLFSILDHTGHLENTIIVGSSDHGDDPFKARYARLSALNSHILHAAGYVYYPDRLMAMQPEGMEERLRRNTQKLTHTLDMYPTIRSMLHNVSGTVVDYTVDNGDFQNPLLDPENAATQGCIAGIDLTTIDIPDDRVTFAINLASNHLVAKKHSLRLYALSTKDYALYHRKSRKRVGGLRQGKDNEYTLQFGSCTRSTRSLCMMTLDPTMKEYFRRAVASLRRRYDGSGFVGQEVKESELVKFFVDVLGGESAVQAAEYAMSHAVGEAEKNVATESSVNMIDHDVAAVKADAGGESAIVEASAPDDVRSITEPLRESAISVFLREHGHGDNEEKHATGAISYHATSTELPEEHELPMVWGEAPPWAGTDTGPRAYHSIGTELPMEEHELPMVWGEAPPRAVADTGPRENPSSEGSAMEDLGVGQVGVRITHSGFVRIPGLGRDFER